MFYYGMHISLRIYTFVFFCGEVFFYFNTSTTNPVEPLNKWINN